MCCLDRDLTETKSSRPDQTGPSQPIILFSWLFVITNVLLMILYPQSVAFMIAVFYKQFVKCFLSFFKQTGKVLVCFSKPHFSQMCQRSQFSVTILRTHFRWYKSRLIIFCIHERERKENKWWLWVFVDIQFAVNVLFRSRSDCLLLFLMTSLADYQSRAASIYVTTCRIGVRI